MANYTLELRDVLEYTRRSGIGLDRYPIFDENYREHLNKKIIDHYWYYEIAHETIDQFVRQMGTKMAEIMPFYNQLYESERLEFDPLNTMNIVNTVTGKTSVSNTAKSVGESTSVENSTNTTTTSSDNDSEVVNYAMPQTRLSGQEDYATSATDSKSRSDSRGSGENSGKVVQSSDATNTANTDSDVNNVSRTSGSNMPMGSLLNNIRESFLNIDMMVIKELEELFLAIIETGDNYTERGYYGLL